MTRVILLLRCGSCRFAALYVAPFTVALLAAGVDHPLFLAWGLVHCSLTSLGTELLNRLADQAEDRVNRPERTALCDALGYGAIREAAGAVWAAVIVLDAIGLVIRPDAIVASCMALSILMPVGYSYGGRFKARRYLALPALATVFALPFVTGWAVGGALTGELLPARDIAPIVAIMGLFIAGLAGIKDITDVLGDERVGYRSLWVSLVRDHRMAVLRGFAAAPYAGAAAAVAGGWLPLRFLWLLPWALIGIPLALSSTAAASDEQRHAVRELFYHFWFVLSGTILFLFHPVPATVAWLIVTTIFWIGASQLLHWSDGLRVWKLRMAGRLVGVVMQGGHR